MATMMRLNPDTLAAEIVLAIEQATAPLLSRIRALETHEGIVPPSAAKPKVKYRGAWSAGREYAADDAVEFDGGPYFAHRPTVRGLPPTVDAAWKAWPRGLER
jgi:hypothetical protein